MSLRAPLVYVIPEQTVARPGSAAPLDRVNTACLYRHGHRQVQLLRGLNAELRRADERIE